MAITSAEVIVRHTSALGLGRGSFAMRGRRVPAPKAGAEPGGGGEECGMRPMRDRGAQPM